MQTTTFKELGYAATRGLLPVSRLGPVHIRRGRIERSVSEEVCARSPQGLLPLLRQIERSDTKGASRVPGSVFSAGLVFCGGTTP
jgi:hypothetical protein